MSEVNTQQQTNVIHCAACTLPIRLIEQYRFFDKNGDVICKACRDSILSSGDTIDWALGRHEIDEE